MELSDVLEIQKWGWNAVTISFVGTIFFTFLESWGLWQQNKAIWKSQSGEAVSVIWFSYAAALFSIIFVYSLSISSIALFINGLFILGTHIPILIGLWKFKGFRTIEKILAGLFLLSIIAMTVLPDKDWFFLLFSFVGIGFTAMQPIEILFKKSSGVVEIKLLAVIFTSTSFWVIYAFAVNDWVLKIICPSYLIIFGATILLWFKYRK